MNLSQIERKFQQLEVKENYMRYFYNPVCKKISGVKQHHYIDELHEDYREDLKTFGMDPFIYSQVGQNDGVTSKKLADQTNSFINESNKKSRMSINNKSPTMYNEIDEDDEYQSQVLPVTTEKKQPVKFRASLNLKNKAIYRHSRTSNIRRKSTEGIFIGKPKHIIQQCTVPQHLLNEKKKEEIISNLPSAREERNTGVLRQPEIKQHNVIKVEPALDEKQFMMSLYKIKSKNFLLYNIKYVVPGQILQILRKFVDNQRQLTQTPLRMPPSPVPEKQLSPRFGKRQSTVYLRSSQDVQSLHHKNLSIPNFENSDANLPNVNASSQQQLDLQPVKTIEGVQIISNPLDSIIVNDSLKSADFPQQPQQPHQRLTSAPMLISENFTVVNVTAGDLFLFNIKLTDLTDLENPFVIYENKRIDDDGYLIFDNFDLNVLNPQKVFPWLNSSKDLEKRTLKIEVTFMGELILLRFIHLDRFYPIKYPQVMLEIANNMIQNQQLLKKQYAAHSKSNDGSSAEVGILIQKKVELFKGQNLLQNEKVKSSMDQSSSIDRDGNHKSGNNLPFLYQDVYFALKPIHNEHYKLLTDLKSYNVTLKDLKDTLVQRSLDQIPQQMKQLRIIIEYTDCIVQAKDLLDYNILIDDNKQNNMKISQAVNNYYQNQQSPTMKYSNKNYARPSSQVSSGHNYRRTSFNPILLGQKLAQSKSNQMVNRSTIDPQKASLIQHYGQQRSVQFYLRKELDDQLAQNRKLMQLNKPGSAAVNMRDNRQVFNHLNESGFQTRPMTINGSQSSQMMRMTTRPSYENISLIRQRQHMNRVNINKVIDEIQKGEIDVNEEEMGRTQDLMDGFQSVKSSYGMMSNHGEDNQNAFLNYPYSRAQDVLGASMATPSYYFRKSNDKKTVKDLFYMKRDGHQYSKRPSTSGRQSGQGFQMPPALPSNRLKLQNSVTYFDEKEQIFGIQGKNKFGF